MTRLVVDLLVRTLAPVFGTAACPDCIVGRSARAQVWSEGFGRNLMIAVLPFLLVGLVGCAAEVAERRRQGSRGR